MKRKIVSSVIAGVLLFGGMAMAAGRYEKIEVFFERLHVAINGQQSELSRDSIIYNGSVYIPLRSMGEMLGAEVGWTNEDRTVHLDFLKDRKTEVFQASTIGIYQYIAIEHNRLLSEMIQYFKTDNMDAMKDVIEQYAHLESVSNNLQNTKMAETFEKMGAAIELVRSGWETKTVDDYALAWTIFYQNADVLNTDLKDIISGKTTIQLQFPNANP